MRETRELRSDQEEARKSFAQAFSKACRARDSVSRPFSVSKRRKDTKNIPVGCFSKKTLAGGFLNAVPDGGRLSPIPPEIPPKRVQRAAGDFNRLCGCPSRPLVPKGGTRFRGQGRRACGSPLRAVGPPKKSRLPARSALNGAHRAPAPPDEGSCVPVARAQDRPERKRRPLRKAFRRKPFLPSCVCRRRLRPQGRCPRTPTAFEKAGKTFTCLAKTQARAFGLAALSKPRRLKAPFATRPVRSRTGHAPDALRISARLILPPMVLGSSSTYSMTRGYL